MALDEPDSIERADNADMLALAVGFRPLDPSDPLPRDDPQSIRKMKAEGRLSEIRITLGWLLNTREFKINLTKEKARDWIADINRILEGATVGTTEMEELIG